MLFTEKVREDLEREVGEREFDVFFRETLRRDDALAGFESAGALLHFLRETEERRAVKDAATVALLRAYESSREDRARVGALLLLVLWPDVAAAVRAKTRQVCRRAGFRSTDAEDVEQTLVLDLLRRLPRFDPERASLRTFVTRLLDHAVATILAAREAGSRDWRRSRDTLHDLVEDGCGALAARWTTLDPRVCRERVLGIEATDEQADRETRLDVTAAVEALPPELRAVARLLMTAGSNEVARTTRLPRATLYDLTQRIRRHLERAGITPRDFGPASRRERR